MADLFLYESRLPFLWEAGFSVCKARIACYTEYVHIKKKEEAMKRYTINYEETYSGTFTVELNDDSTEQDAINELLDNAYEYRLGEQVELSDSDAQVIKTENVEG